MKTENINLEQEFKPPTGNEFILPQITPETSDEKETSRAFNTKLLKRIESIIAETDQIELSEPPYNTDALLPDAA